VVVSRHGYPDCALLVDPFVRLHEVENPQLQVVKHADLQCIEEVGLKEVAHNTGNLSNQVESSVNMVQPEFSISYLGVGIAECSI
jgi:hypothetical protein